MDIVVETTATVKARQDLNVLNHELRHRLKNSLATVQTLVRQTLKSVDQRGPIDTLTERLIALAYAQDVLFNEGWSSATVEDVARASLTSLMDLGRISLSGPPIQINARAAMSLSLMLHELATNAAKYGALSGADGNVSFTWAMDRTRQAVQLTWKECGGPIVKAPAKAGFGSRLIDMGLSPRSQVKRNYEEEGLLVTVSSPTEDLTEQRSLQIT